MGHASITITLDRYGQMLPGNESEAARLLDTFLLRPLVDYDRRERSSTRARL